ncbi:hypothetical protein SU69_05440 [Thermosipho melanesiensis]|uniref:Oligosaccharide repeat unit polymerase n=2 Tax=Thermosipho melanesiensis TaxID=46541 RepID=A6LLX4_THEM4|nr:O-antigen polymerase [Thermosipho melanesiensis]ABR30925.1 hypothetical protein Tmel_1065 [Thermosipho melanesiensis BI429]APT74869.1 hypothetical protein BW47_05700 [Thermosipho melanesiensis]OOC35970.1 hypothetical protein SU68_05500 [Thermosipho melanesiensis]OOC38109.1 hypothetical protein SU69_05440 [Thermosipho melanesiensis]OOC38239.1 hypothetical protein SU70_05450 [Thermosipho melanesiensis]
MGILLLSIIALLFLYKLDNFKQKWFYISEVLIILGFSFAFFMKNSVYIRKYILIFDSVKMSWEVFLFFISVLFSYFIGYFFTRKIVFVFKVGFGNYKKTRVILLYYFFSFLSFLGFVHNLSATNLGLLFVNPRLYEHLFGRNVIFNYLYFLNVPALIIYIFAKKHLGINIKGSFVINLFLLFESFFHGIKFTISDTFIQPFLFLNLLEKSKNKKRMLFWNILFFLTFFVILLLFFVSVRGGVWGIINYYISNFYNFSYYIENNKLVFSLPLRLLVPREFFRYINFNKFESVGSTGFILNLKYNTYTAFLNLYNIFWYVGPLLFIPFLMILISSLEKIRNNMFYCFLLDIMLYCSIYMFFSWQFTKFKYIYYIILLFFADYISRDKKG